MTKLLWIDMEMTGLNVEKEVPIEIAAIVTDFAFNEIDSYHAVIKQDPVFLERMDDWNKKTHGATGLIARVPQGKAPSVIEDEMLELIGKHFKEPAIIAGNSIGQDRTFINKHLPRIAGKLHYRMLDVSSWKIVMQERFNVRYTKQGTHKALDDIRESIAELKLYLSHVKA